MKVTLVQGIIIALIILVAIRLVRGEPPVKHRVVIVPNRKDADLMSALDPEATVLTHCEVKNLVDNNEKRILANNQWAAHTNNTLPVRPGTKYALDLNSVIDPNEMPPAFVITLHYKPGCEQHQLTMLFEHIAKEMMNDGTASNASIRFERKIIDVTNPLNLVGGFPKITKTRRNGQVLEYKGYTDYGPLRDWVLNEGLLF